MPTLRSDAQQLGFLFGRQDYPLRRDAGPQDRDLGLAEYFYEDWSKVATVLGDGDGASGARFLESIRLAAPVGFADDDLGGDKRRWSVKTSFDFSDFAA